MSEQSTPTPPGWYADPQMANTQRYWDGERWTDQVAPGAPVSTPNVKSSDALDTAGWLTAVFVPIVGFVIGCVMLGRRPQAGVGMMLLALACGIGWWMLLLDQPLL